MGGSGKRKKSNNALPSPGDKVPVLPDSTATLEVVPSLAESFDTDVRPLIDLVDQLRGFGLDQDINLPAVAVIGDQSAGKSSVLEAISGVQLPRGTGIVTRCPLEMRMKKTKKETQWSGKISYKDTNGEKHEEILSEPSEVCDLVLQAQREMTKEDKGISHDYITLEVKSPDVPDLTLIDLPGIARIAMEGQPYDIAYQIKTLLTKFIKRQETIILVVQQSNDDIATCEALSMAQELDPEGCRTIGVLTKPDLVDEGSEGKVLQTVRNEGLYLAKGYIIVKCRGQKAINEKQTLPVALKEEAKFFEEHPQFSELDPSQWGIKSLSSKLAEELAHHIKTVLPQVKDDVMRAILGTERQLEELGQDLPDSPGGKRVHAMRLVKDFMKMFACATMGERPDIDVPCEVEELCLKTRKCFEGLVHESSSRAPDISPALLDHLRKEIEHRRGRELPNFSGKYEIVERHARIYIQKLEVPSLRCLENVQTMTDASLRRLAKKLFERYPDFLQQVMEVIHKTKTKIGKTCKEEIKKFFEMEGMIFSQDKTYLGSLKCIEEEGKKEQQNPTGTVSFGSKRRIEIGKEENDTPIPAEMKILQSLKAYYMVSATRINDVVPMIIQFYLCRKLTSELEAGLQQIAADEKIIQKIKEDDVSANKRRFLRNKMGRLLKADASLSGY